ncbi:DNA-methyltransferase [Photobacterium damselae]|uniref:DNA-methyltransferase n=1 Tax=Photobacterium damselae TaxID=38293 RepID=UPI00406959A5
MNQNITLLQGNCLDLLRSLPNESIDAVITDVPYGIDFSPWDILHDNKNSALMGTSPAQAKSKLFKSRGKPKNGWSKEDRKRTLEFQSFCEDFLSELLRVMKPCSPLIAFTGRQNQHRFTIASENVGFIYKDTIAWDKVSAPFRAQNINKVLEKRGIEPVNGEMRLGNLAPMFEPIIWCFKPYGIGETITDHFIENGLGCFNSEKHKSNILRYSARIKDKIHETQKPLELIEDLVEMFTLNGQVVLDPFMGGGTMGVASVAMGRSFVGIEIEPENFNNASKRIMAAKVRS